MKIVVHRPVLLPVAGTKLLRIMKLMIILLTVVALQVSATGYSQGITLSKKNVSLEEALVVINKQIGYLYFANHGVLQKAKRFDLHVLNATLTQVLAICFADQPLIYTIKDSVIIIKEKPVTVLSGISLREEGKNFIDVKGRVLNENGESVQGVSVTVKETAKSTVTDANGEFSLMTVDADAILVFTHVSMETFELKVSGKTELSVRLKTKISELGDVTITVSTGYEDIPKERATGSFTKIENATLNQQVGTNILSRLDGVTSSLLFNIGKNNNNPQNNTNISIRGLSTINGPLDPLIVLDGFIYEGDINNINPNDVDNITILKDAAATSIWGVRAGNGVLVINTKKGKFNQKLQISINSNLIIGLEPNLFSLPQMSSTDYINVEEVLFNKGYFDNQIASFNMPALTPAVEVFLKKRNGLISEADSASQIDGLKLIDSREEYKKHFYRNRTIQQYAVNLSGGTTNNAYTLTAAYDKSLSELDNKFDKLNIGIHNRYRPFKNVIIDFGVYYTNSKSNSGKPINNQISVGGRRVPYLKFADAQGNPISISNKYRADYIDTAGAGKLLNWNYYPLEDYKFSNSKADLNEIFVNMGAEYEIFKFLTISAKYQYQRQESVGQTFHDLQSFTARDLINSFSQLDRNIGSVTRAIPIGAVRLINNGYIKSHTFRGQSNFNHAWGSNEINSIVGVEIRELASDGNSYTNYGFKRDPLSYATMDFVNRYPTFITGETTVIPGSPSFYNKISRFISFYGNVAYTLKKRYTLTFSSRRDGSNIFGVNTNDKWKPLWSAGLGWNVSKEQFYKLGVLPSLKMRATYGYSGNVDLRRSALPVAELSFNSNIGVPQARIVTLNDPLLKWEQVNQLNFGLDFSSKRNSLYGSIDYYYKWGVNLYAPGPYDYTAWGVSTTITQNIANIEGNGFDLILHSKNIDRVIKWNTNFIFNYNTNKTTKYFTRESNHITSLLGAGGLITPIIGKPLYAIAAYKWGGLDSQGNPQGYANGQLTTNYNDIFNEAFEKGVGSNIVYKGPASPTIFGSIINTFTWKGVSISVNVSYKFGYYFRKSTISYDQLINSGFGHSDFSKRWQKPGDESITNIPSFVYPNVTNRDGFYLNSEINVLKADHIRLQYINLSYTLRDNDLGKLPLKDLQIYLNASNLGILWRANKEKIDPEYNTVLAPLKTFAIGIRTNF